MRTGDILDALLVHQSHPDAKKNWAAIKALGTLYDDFCPQCINSNTGDARREIPEEAIAKIRAALTAALEGIEIARHMPREPRLSVVPNEPDA